MPCDCAPPYIGPSVVDVCSASNYLVFMTLVEIMLRNACEITEMCERIIPKENPDLEYDFIVIGGGSGGATVAGRLSEVSDWNILLLEAGIDEPPATQVPINENIFQGNEYADWNYKTEPEPVGCRSKDEHRCVWSRAKMLGGCSVMDNMIYTRGTPADFDGWEAAGNEGWGFEDVLPWFKYSEDNLEIDTRVDSKYHGIGGPITTKRFNHQPELAWDILSAAEEVGIPVTDDMNGENITGFTIVQATNRNGARLSMARAYLRPARNRTNLHIMLNSTVTKILVSSEEKKTAEGVEFVYRNVTYTVKAKKEIILAAGAINSPQILLLSGIGPKNMLDDVGIEQVHELPGVGQNLTNHVSFTLFYTLDNVLNTNILDESSLLEYITNRDGWMSSIGMSQVTGLFSSKYTTADDPDLQFFLGAYTQKCSTGEANTSEDPNDPESKRSLVILPVNTHPKSRGYIALRSSNPLDAPLMYANYLTVPEDADRLVEGIRLAQRLVNSSILISKYGIRYSNSSYGTCFDEYEFDSDDYWICAMKFWTSPENHQASSCRMGPVSDKYAVVDNKLRVHGINALRIADASVMPKVVSGGTHATVVMIAERAVDFIKSTWL